MKKKYLIIKTQKNTFVNIKEHKIKNHCVKQIIWNEQQNMHWGLANMDYSPLHHVLAHASLAQERNGLPLQTTRDFSVKIGYVCFKAHTLTSMFYSNLIPGAP